MLKSGVESICPVSSGGQLLNKLPIIFIPSASPLTVGFLTPIPVRQNGGHLCPPSKANSGKLNLFCFPYFHHLSQGQPILGKEFNDVLMVKRPPREQSRVRKSHIQGDRSLRAGGSLNFLLTPCYCFVCVVLRLDVQGRWCTPSGRGIPRHSMVVPSEGDGNFPGGWWTLRSGTMAGKYHGLPSEPGPISSCLLSRETP